jgi:hypothetical protein
MPRANLFQKIGLPQAMKRWRRRRLRTGGSIGWGERILRTVVERSHVVVVPDADGLERKGAGKKRDFDPLAGSAVVAREPGGGHRGSTEHARRITRRRRSRRRHRQLPIGGI